MVQNGRMSTKPSPPIPKPKKIRLTISVTPEVHAAFLRLAKAGNMSIGGAMGEWMGDTLEGVEYMASTMERARAAPNLVMKEIHAYALGLADETGSLMRQISEKGRAERAVAASAVAAPGGGSPFPPSLNTGGKVPKKTTKPNKGGV
jgi:hypothetical protein